MTDREFAEAVETCRMENGGFHHREHLRLAWIYLAECRTPEAAGDRMRATLRRFATAAGCPDKYHETLTAFWMRYLAAVKSRLTGVNTFDQLLAARGDALGKDLPFTYYSRARLLSGAARVAWVPPDLRPMDDDGTEGDPGGTSGHSPSRPVRRGSSQR